MKCIQKNDKVNGVDQKAGLVVVHAESNAKDPEVTIEAKYTASPEVANEAGGPRAGHKVDQKADPGAVIAESEAKGQEVTIETKNEASPVVANKAGDPRAGNNVDQKADPGAVIAESEVKGQEATIETKNEASPEVANEAGDPRAGNNVDQKADPGAVVAEIVVAIETKDPEVAIEAKNEAKGPRARIKGGINEPKSRRMCKTKLTQDTHQQPPQVQGPRPHPSHKEESTRHQVPKTRVQTRGTAVGYPLYQVAGLMTGAVQMSPGS